MCIYHFLKEDKMNSFGIFLLASTLFVSNMATAQNIPLHSDESWCKQIVLREVTRIEEFFKANQNSSDSEKIVLIAKQDLRASFFRMEVIARIMSDEGGKYLQDQGARFKAMEDLIGKVDLSYSLVKISKKLEEPRLVDYFQAQQEQNSKNLVNKFKAEGFWNDSTVTATSLRKDLSKKVAWKEGKSERKYLIKHASDYLQYLHKMVKENSFNNSDIEKGLHELRRRLRWVMIEAISLNGAIQFSAETNVSPSIEDWFQSMNTKNPDIMKSKYLVAVTPEVRNPIIIPQLKTAIISELIGNIGDLKDISEMQIYTAEALAELNASAADKKAIATKLNILLKSIKINHQELAQKIQSQLADTKILKEFAQDLEDLN